MSNKREPPKCTLVISGLLLIAATITASHGGHAESVTPNDPAQCVTLQLS